MKILITEQQEQRIIQEFDARPHFRDRLNQRFFNLEFYDVIAVEKGGNYARKIIGRYPIPPDARTTVERIVKLLERPYYGSANNDGILVKLYYFPHNASNVQFIGNPNEQKQNMKLYLDREHYSPMLQEKQIVGDNEPLTAGHMLVCILHEYQIVTTFLSRNMEASALTAKRQYHYPDVHIVNNPETELDRYIDIDALRKYKEIEPQTIENPSELSNKKDKAARLAAYNAKMEKLRTKF